ncbi:MAG: tripartite tricarboxylate transporter TctB family protein [Thermodesulfobacteriota bacterium]|nr:tripartite tricarboxylate transporter TctB family protein [Thermodesulfobacteriota bacterium]
MKKVDIGVGAGLLTLSIWLFWYSGRYKELAVMGYGPDLFPRILASMMILLASGLIINALRGKSLKKEDNIDPKGFLRVLISIGICIGYLFLINWLGFATSTFLFLFILMTLLKQKRILLRISASLIVSLTVWVIFRYFLVIPLPEGLLI